MKKTPKGFYFVPGGRIKTGESSLAAAAREIYEETGLIIEASKFELLSVYENFYIDKRDSGDEKVHEICFIYRAPIVPTIDPKYGLYEFAVSEINELDIKPEFIKRYL